MEAAEKEGFKPYSSAAGAPSALLQEVWRVRTHLPAGLLITGEDWLPSEVRGTDKTEVPFPWTPWTGCISLQNSPAVCFLPASASKAYNVVDLKGIQTYSCFYPLRTISETIGLRLPVLLDTRDPTFLVTTPKPSDSFCCWVLLGAATALCILLLLLRVQPCFILTLLVSLFQVLSRLKVANPKLTIKHVQFVLFPACSLLSWRRD